MLQIFPFSQSLQIEVDRDEEADGLPKLVMPKGGAKSRLLLPYMYLYFALFPCLAPDMIRHFVFVVLILIQAEAEARKVICDVSTTEYSQLLTRQAAGRANHMCDGDLPSRAKPSEVDGDEGTSKKRKREQVKSAPRKRKAPASIDSDANDEDTVDD